MKILSGNEAKLAWAKGEVLEMSPIINPNCWWELRLDDYTLDVFDNGKYSFRAKPKLETIEILPPDKVVLDPITGSVGLVYGDIAVAKE